MMNIETRVFSRIKNKYPTSLKTKYPNTFFTNSDRIADNPQFPTIYIHEMSSAERGRDLDGTTINAVLSTFQIEVTDNESMANVTEVMNNVVETMKSMRFEVLQMPEFSNTPSVYRKVARFRRVIARNDTL